MGTDFLGTDGGTKYSYFLSVCGAMSESAASFCVQVDPTISACQYEINGDMQTFDLGNWNPSTGAQWSFIDPNVPSLGVQYNLTGATQCWANGGSAEPYQTTVQFHCARAQSNGFKVQRSPSPCVTTFMMSTPLACPAERVADRRRPTIVLTEN